MTRVYVSGPNAVKKRVYVSGPKAGQPAQLPQPKIIQPPKTGISGFAQNAKTDFGSFAKGVLGIGREFITHPGYNFGKLAGMGGEVVKRLPQAGVDLAKNIYNLPKNTPQAIGAFNQLRQIPLQTQKEELGKIIQRIKESPRAKENPNLAKVAELGMGVLGNYTQYSRLGEKVYNEPFSAALDIIPATKALGGGKVLAKGGSIINKIPAVARTTEKISDAFVPMGKLKRLGYGDVAEDVSKTGTNIRRSQEGIIKSTVKKFDDLNLSKAERTEMFEMIDKGRRTPGYVPTSPNPKVQKAIDWYMKEELPKIQKMAGYKPQGITPLQEGGKTAPIQNYMHHLFTPTKETSFGGKLSAPQRGFLKQSKDIEGFIDDPVVSISAVKSKAATANIKDGFIKRVTEKYGKPADAITEFKGGKVIDKITGDELMKYKGGYLPKDLGEELMRLEKGEPGWLKTILAPSRSFNRNWKPLATAVRPRYHLRNIIGNIYNASFIGGGKLRRYPQAAFQQMKAHIATQMRDGTIAGKVYKSLFKEAPEHKYIKMAAEDDVVGKGFFSVDINDMAEVADKAEDFSKLIAKMDSPAAIYKVPVLRQWMKGMQHFGSAIEDNARLGLYIDRLKKGASRIEAKAYVNKHLFDYMGGLGEADKVIKAIIPFWSWTRFNVPLQFGALGKNPLRHLLVQEGGKPWVQQNEANNPEYQYLSQRERDMGSIKIGEEQKDGKTYDKYMRTQSVLPIQDLGKITDPENAGISPMWNMLKQGYNMINPPQNPQDNLDYFGRPVEQYPGENKKYLNIPVRGTGKEILQSIPFINEINKAIGGSYSDENRPSGKSRMETVFSPTSQSLQDREKNRQYAESDFNTLVKGDFAPGLESNFKYVIKGLLDKPQDSVLNKNKNTLIELLKQQGYSEEAINILIKKSIESVIKNKATINMPGKQRNVTDQELVKQILNKANKLQPFFTQ